MWSSYAGRSEDLSDNPWRTPSSDPPTQPDGSTAQSAPSHTASLAVPRRAHKPQEHLQWESSQGARNESEAGAGPWADLHALQQDVWGDVHPTRSSDLEWPTHPPTEPNLHSIAPQVPQQPSLTALDEDDFGDFEQAKSQSSVVDTKTPTPHLSKSTGPNALEIPLNKAFSTTASIPDPHHLMPEPDQECDPWGGLESFGKVKTEESAPEVQSWRSAFKGHEETATRSSTAETSIAEVLWDADDWGAFSEDPVGSPTYVYDDEYSTTARAQPQPTTRTTTATHAPSKPPTKDRSVSEDTRTTHSKPSSVLPSSNEPPPSWDTDEWEPFSPPPNSIPAPNVEGAHTIPPGPQKPCLSETLTPSRPSSAAPPISNSPAKPATPSPLPPTNVPPPSILLSLLSSLILQLPTQVRTVSSQPHAPASLSKALHNCLASLRVAARILAGRRLRWKRDTHLLQSMAIGPSHAGKSGGMKLTGVDKAEAKREEREAVEFVRVWKAGLGGIRAALAEVSGRVEGARLMLPEIGEGMGGRVKALKGDGGGGGRCCFLCGLRREERVGGVDEGVEDGWGEWWVEFWGHVECKAFWGEHERFLLRRG